MPFSMMKKIVKNNREVTWSAALKEVHVGQRHRGAIAIGV
jgi:hypothetical protein